MTVAFWILSSPWLWVSGEDQQAPALKIAVGSKAPAFALPSSDGRTVQLSDYAGHNVLIGFYRGFW